MRRTSVLVCALLLVGAALAQESARYKLEEYAFNAGGHPHEGTILTSARYQMTLDAIGDSVVVRGLSSARYSVDGGFVAGYPPAAEVTGLVFTASTVLEWDPEPSVGTYNLYRGLISSWSTYGSCLQPGLTTNSTSDSNPIPADDGFFYLVTAENRLAEEGTKGESAFGERLGTFCMP